MLISKEFRFEASHVLPKHPGKCSELHGHSFRLVVTVSGPVDPETGFVMDYLDLKKIVQENLIELVDHHHLGYGHLVTTTDIQKLYPSAFDAWFYPSSENLVMKFAQILSPLISNLGKGRSLAELELDETCTSQCIWRSSMGV